MKSGSPGTSHACVTEASAAFSISGLAGNYCASPNRKESMSTGPTRFEVQIVAQFDNHNSQVWRVSWNITSTLLASSGDDGCVRLWKGAAPSLACLCPGLRRKSWWKDLRRRCVADFVASPLSQPTTWTTGSARASWRATAARSAAHRVSPQPWAPSWAPPFTPLRTPWTGCRQEGRRCGASARHSPTPENRAVRTDNLTTPHTDSERCCSLTDYLEPTVFKRCTRAKSLAHSIQRSSPRPVELAVWCAVSIFTKTPVIPSDCTDACCSAVSGPTLHCRCERKNRIGIKSNK